MTDWCLVERLQEAMYGSADNIVWWRNVPILVILNVPGDVELGKIELLQFLLRPDVLGTADHWMYHAISREEFGGPRPKFILMKLGAGLPDQEMKSHITEGHTDVWVYDWTIDNGEQENDSGEQYNPRVKAEYDLYKRYDIPPEQGWEFWEYHLATEEARRKQTLQP